LTLIMQLIGLQKCRVWQIERWEATADELQLNVDKLREGKS